ncbi:MAG: hypothetical protein MK212_15515 [Saprospiraceae bacterium]|nr:hypothetical protein [Saprospiraceae bacterium]
MKIELSHDILARTIDDKVSAEKKMQRKVGDFIKNRYRYYQEQKALLSQDDINYISPHFAYIKFELSDEECQFIQDSKDSIKEKKEQKAAAEKKKQQEITDAKINAEKEKTKRQKIIGFAGLIIAGVAIGFSIYFWNTEQAALINEREMFEKNQQLKRQMREITLRDTTISKLSSVLGIQRDSINRYIIQIGNFNDSLQAERNRIDTLYQNLKNAHEHLKRLNSELELDNNYLIKDKGKLQKDKEKLRKEKEEQKSEITKAKTAVKHAESVTLSVQAQTAYNTNKPKEAYQLAAAAWERNPKNKTACRILGNLARERLDAFSYPKGNYKMIIDRLNGVYKGKLTERQIKQHLN